MRNDGRWVILGIVYFVHADFTLR